METARETRGAGGTAAEIAEFPGSFRSSLRSSFGESRLGGPVDGGGNRKPTSVSN